MKVIVFGASGMVGAGVVIECLESERVESVLAVVRKPTGASHPKLREHVRSSFLDFADEPDLFRGYDACFYCLGITSVGMTEDAYRRVTYDMTLAAAAAVAAASPRIVFCFVSGAGTDATEQGNVMWARVKGKTENALTRMPIQAYHFRPGFIQPRKGVKSKTPWLRAFYAIAGPLYPLLSKLAPAYVTTTESIGRAMIQVAASGTPERVLENAAINRLASA